nr:hypothetical protein CFP56_03374 [Quercus suber]
MSREESIRYCVEVNKSSVLAAQQASVHAPGPARLTCGKGVARPSLKHDSKSSQRERYNLLSSTRNVRATSSTLMLWTPQPQQDTDATWRNRRTKSDGGQHINSDFVSRVGVTSCTATPARLVAE